MKRNILAAIDFSECSDYALEWILRHLRLTADDTLTLVTVNEPPAEMRRANDSFDQVELESAAHAQLEKLWNAYEKKIPSDNSTAKVEFKVETGKPMKILIDLCHSGKYTMVNFFKDIKVV
jgi:nucleotide-binding universal stress UspA family protein